MEAVAELLTAIGTPKTVALTGAAGAGKTTVLAQLIAAAIGQHRLRPYQIAATALTRHATTALQDKMRGEIFGQEADDYDADDTGTLTGTLCNLAYSHATAPRIMRGELRSAQWHRHAFVERLSEELKQIADTQDPNFIAVQRRRILRALRVIEAARLAGDDLLRRASEVADHDLDPAFVLEIAERYAAFKAERALYDFADLMLAPVAPENDIALAVIDEASDLPAAARALLQRLFPRAVIVLAGASGCDASVNLPPRARDVRRWIIDAPKLNTDLVPGDIAEAGALIIVGNTYHERFWVAWCKRHGLAFRTRRPALRAKDLADICALYLADQGDDVNPVRLKRLAAALGYDTDGNTCAADFPQWTNWRAMARLAYQDNDIAYVARVLKRYGRLRAPLVDICSPRSAGKNADVVILDLFSFRHDRALLPLALSRARRQLVVLQHESNPKLRL